MYGKFWLYKYILFALQTSNSTNRGYFLNHRYIFTWPILGSAVVWIYKSFTYVPQSKKVKICNSKSVSQWITRPVLRILSNNCMMEFLKIVNDISIYIYTNTNIWNGPKYTFEANNLLLRIFLKLPLHSERFCHYA